MNTDESLWKSTTLHTSGIQPGSVFGDAVQTRQDIFSMIASAEQAVLAPANTGAWPHALRAALACRIALQNNANTVAASYKAMINTPEFAGIEDPGNDGASLNLSAVVTFMDRVALQTRDVAAEDIELLKKAGVSDADIVRLCELNACVSFQVRVVAGLAAASSRAEGAAS